MTEPAGPVERTLERHRRRRVQGLATVSVLVGPPEAAAAAWDRHVGRPSLAIEAVEARSADTLAAGCVATVCRRANLWATCVGELGRRLARPVDAVLPELSAHDLEYLWRSVLPGAGDPDVLRLIRVVVTSPLEQWADAITADLPGWRGVVAVDHLLGSTDTVSAEVPRRPPAEAPRVQAGLRSADGARFSRKPYDPPAVWVAGPVDDVEWLTEAAGPLAGLAASVPRWPVGVGVTAEAAARASAGDGRAATLVRGGIVVVDRERPAPPPARVAAAEDDGEDDDPPDPARSAAERLLFELLNARWAGLFALNVALDFPFGNRPAEADLYAADVRLVIEVDGYHHFQDPARYRRDRRKDWAYQARGYRVLRVLAEDVVPRRDEILDRVGTAVDHGRRHPLGGGPTGTP